METLIAKFEKRLDKVKKMHPLGKKGSLQYMKSMEYIKGAERELEAVKKGGMDELIKYYNTRK